MVQASSERKVRLGQIGVGHREIVLHAPGTAYDEPLLIVVIAGCEYGIAAKEMLVMSQHRHQAFTSSWVRRSSGTGLSNEDSI